MYAKSSKIFKKLSASTLPEKSIISAQFVKIVDQLISDGKVADYKSFAEKYGYAKNLVTHIKGGRQDVPVELLYNVIMDYRIDPSFVFALLPRLKVH